MPYSERKTIISVRLWPEQLKQIDEFAQEQGLGRSEIIRDLLLRGWEQVQQELDS